MKPIVLFVDDDTDLRESMRVGLARGPFEVMTAPSAEAALKILAEKEVAIVVSDDRMPGMRGADFLTLVAEQYPAITTMLLTGFGDLKTAMQAINQARVNRFLLKPCPTHELKQILTDALQLRNLASASARLLVAARRDQALLRDLEVRHPGITQMERAEDGAFVIDESELTELAPANPPNSVEALIDEIESVVERLRQRKTA